MVRMAASLIQRGLDRRLGSDPDIRDDESRYYCNIEMNESDPAKTKEKESDKHNYSVSTKSKKIFLIKNVPFIFLEINNKIYSLREWQGAID